jgi:hypothetical protein
MERGDATWVPPGAVHRLLNHGEAPLRILWTYGSVGAIPTIAATGETFRVGSDAERAATGGGPPSG